MKSHSNTSVMRYSFRPKKAQQYLFCDVISCRKCKKSIRDCWCSPIPCPFCDEEFGFIQDWNIHLQEIHPIQLQTFQKVDKKW